MCRGESVTVTTNRNSTASASSSSPHIRRNTVSSSTESSLAASSTDLFVRWKNSKSDFVPGCAEDGVKINGTLRPKHDPKHSTVIVGIQGTWYDATKFAAHHPGGDILYEFHQKDATAQFLAYHDRNILCQRCKLPTRGSYQFDEKAPGGSKLQGAWMRLNDKFEKEGRYSTPLSFLWSRIAILVLACAGMLSMIHLYNKTQSRLSFLAAAVCMAGIWQQSGFLMHDTMHNHILHDRKADQRLGFLFGNILLGASGRWWRDEHNEHHVFTNTVVEGVGPSDPQMVEDVWIQDERLIPYFLQCTVNFVLDYQQYYFVPILVIVGMFPIKVDAMANTGRLFADICGLALHLAWVGSTLWLLPSTMERVAFYLLANSASGCLGIQLLVSHYAKPWAEKEDTKHPGSWAERQVEAVLDITCPPWLDWFHGGLHIHSVHHLFPRMCRCHYRAVYDDIRTICDEHGLPIDRSSWLEAIVRCLHHFSTIKGKARSGYNKKTKAA